MVSGEFNVSVDRTKGTIAVLVVTGELTVHTAGELPKATAAAVREGHSDLVLDLARVPFCDSSGLNALITIYRRLQANQGSLALAGVPVRLQRLLRLTGIDRLITSHPTVDDAFAHLSKP